MHLSKHVMYSGAKPRGEVAKPKTELAHRDRFIKVASGPRIGYASLQTSDIQRGEAPRRGGEAENRARSQGQAYKFIKTLKAHCKMYAGPL